MLGWVFSISVGLARPLLRRLSSSKQHSLTMSSFLIDRCTHNARDTEAWDFRLRRPKTNSTDGGDALPRSLISSKTMASVWFLETKPHFGNPLVAHKSQSPKI